MAYTINANAKNVWIRDNEDTRDLSIQTDASSVYLDNGRTLEQELGEGSMVSNVATVDNSMSKVIDGTLDGVYESGVMYGKTMVNIMKPVEDITKVGNGTYSGFYLNESGLIKNLKTDTDYLFVVHVKSNTLTGSTTYSLDFGNTDPNNPNQQACFITRQHLPHDALGTYKFIMRTRDSFDGMAFVSRNQLLNKATGGSITFNYMILEYQEGMENWDIPFFGGICDVKMPILRNVGKNLFDGSYEQDKFINEYGTISDSADWCATDFIRVRPNTTYTQNKNIPSSIVYFCFYNEDKQLISTTKPINYNRTFTTPNNCHFIRTSWKYSIDGFDFQFEEGTETTTYEDYKSNILRTSEEIVLREVGGVCDTYNPLTGEYTKRIGEVVLDGSEGWGLSGFTNDNYFVAYCQATTNSAKANSKIKCDKIQYDSRVSVIDTVCEGINIIGDKSLCISMSKSRVSNLSDFTSWLQLNPVAIQYELAEPVTTIVKPSTMTPFAYQNGHVILESGFEGQSLLPTLEYSTVVNRTGQVESVAKTIQTQEKQLTMLEQMLIQNIIGLDYSNTVLALNLEINEVM